MNCKQCGAELDQFNRHPFDGGWCPDSPQGELKTFYLWYDNGSGWFDCASANATLADAIAAAKTGWQTSQHITDDAEGECIVWSNYGKPCYYEAAGHDSRGPDCHASFSCPFSENGAYFLVCGRHQDQSYRCCNCGSGEFVGECKENSPYCG